MKRRACVIGGMHVRVLLLAIFCACGMRAQVPKPVLPHPGLPALKAVSLSEYREHLRALSTVIADCEASTAACHGDRVGVLDDLVHPPAGAEYIERYGWLRDLLDDRDDPSHKRRAELLPHAAQRLAEQQAEMDVPPVAPLLTEHETAARAAVLARREFRTTEDYSLTERLAAWFSRMMGKLFGGVSSLSRMAPWLGTAVQWGALLLAATLLLLWIYRALDRQRVALGRLSGNAEHSAAQAESRAWAELARQHADRGEWRDAVHALYWASIVALEDRRTLRRNGTRTPREALRLIDPASQLREPLRAQTGEFERIWYGLQQASADDYDSALTHYRALQAGSARTAGA